MRSLRKVSSQRNLGVPLPGQGSMVAQLRGNVYWHTDDFHGSALDADEWASQADGLSSVSVANGVVTLKSSTATASTIVTRFFSAASADGNLYQVPFRVSWSSRIYASAGAGVAPTGGLNFFMEVKDTGGTHIARFRLDGTTAGGPTLASPVVRCEVQAGSTASGSFASTAYNPFTTAAGGVFTATSFTEYVLEVTHEGVWFGFNRDPSSSDPPRMIKFFRSPVPRHDLLYMINTRIETNGTAGFTQSAPVYMDVDYIKVEQFLPHVPSVSFQGSPDAPGDWRTGIVSSPNPSAGSGLVVSGAGMLMGMAATTTASAAANLYYAAYDASAASSAVYSYGAAASSLSHLLWISQHMSVGGQVTNAAFPEGGIPFKKGLVVASVNQDGSSVGSSALTIHVVYRVRS